MSSMKFQVDGTMDLWMDLRQNTWFSGYGSGGRLKVLQSRHIEIGIPMHLARSVLLYKDKMIVSWDTINKTVSIHDKGESTEFPMSRSVLDGKGVEWAKQLHIAMCYCLSIWQ